MPNSYQRQSQGYVVSDAFTQRLLRPARPLVHDRPDSYNTFEAAQR
jgi:hypothetical protein